MNESRTKKVSTENFMKGRTLLFGRLLSRLAMVSVAFGLVLQSEATVTTLTHLNSSVQVDSDSPAGMFNWTVDGFNPLQQQWFWCRIGNNPEAPINSLS